MSFFANAKLKQARVQQNLIGEAYVPTPTAEETFDLAFQETRGTELFTSNSLMRERFLNPQKRQLEALRDDGTIPAEIWNTFEKQSRRGRRTDWAGIADYANEELEGNFDFSDESMHAQIRAESEERKNQLGKAAGWGFAPAIAGTGLAILTDPVQAAAMVVPGGQMRFGATAVGTLGKMAFREGAINVGLEAIAQLQVADFKKRIGDEYHLSEGAANLAAAFVFGGVLGAGRAGARIQTGDVRLTDAVEMQDAIIKEMDGRGPLMPTEQSILGDMKLSQDIFQQMIDENPAAVNMSVRDAYTEAARRMRSITDPTLSPTSRATTTADTDLEAASRAPDSELTADYVPDDLNMDDPLPAPLLGDRPVAAVTEEGVEQPVTLRTMYDEIDQKYETARTRVMDYVECRRSG